MSVGSMQQTFISMYNEHLAMSKTNIYTLDHVDIPMLA